MNRNIKDLVDKKLKCDHCKNKPDQVYFFQDSGEVLSVICNDCKSAFEATIKGMGKMYTDISEAFTKMVH